MQQQLALIALVLAWQNHWHCLLK